MPAEEAALPKNSIRYHFINSIHQQSASVTLLRAGRKEGKEEVAVKELFCRVAKRCFGDEKQVYNTNPVVN
jgi:hypothetical protein